MLFANLTDSSLPRPQSGRILTNWWHRCQKPTPIMPPNPPSELSSFMSPPVITLTTQGKPLSAATLPNPVTPIPMLPTNHRSQRVALLYTLLETTPRQHVHAQLGTTNTTLEAAIAAIKFAFRISQPIEDPLADFFSWRQQKGEALHASYLALVHLAALAFPLEGHPGHVFERLVEGKTDPHLRW